MKLNLIALLFLLTAITLTGPGCNKDDDHIKIDGTVTDPALSIPVQEAEVYLYGKVFEGGHFNPTSSVITAVTTDEQGKFNINIKQVKASNFELVVEKNQYFTYTKSLSTQDISSGKSYTASVNLHPEGWLHLHVQNTNPYNSSDLITYRILSDNPSCPDCCNSTYLQGQGKTYNVESYCRSKGKTTVSIVWNVHKGGNSKADSAFVVLPVFDTAYYHLAY